MIIEQYGIQLRRITANDIEMVRQWRNRPEIRKRMEYKKYITQKMQQQWFKRVNNPLNYYFIIHYKNKDIGVINVKNVNINEEFGEGGIFISDSEFINSEIPVFATLCLINSVFYVLNISNKSFIRIMRNNEAAISYNKQLGYTLIPGQEKIKNQWYILTREDYEKKAKKLNRAAAILSGDYELPRVKGKVSSINLEIINTLLRQ